MKYQQKEREYFINHISNWLPEEKKPYLELLQRHNQKKLDFKILNKNKFQITDKPSKQTYIWNKKENTWIRTK